MNDSTRNDEADRRCSEWLDADANQPSGEPALPLEGQAQVRAADLLLVNALLSGLSDRAADERADRIRRVMEVIDGTPPSLQASRRVRGWPSAVAVAATLLVAFSFVWSQFAQDTRASEVLREIGEVAMANVDRIYHLRRDVSTSNPVRQLEGELYLRGREGFVLRCGDSTLGRSVDEYWLVAKNGDVVVAENFEWMVAESERGRLELELLKELAVDSRQVPLMQLSSVIELMQHDYNVTLDSDVDRGDQSVDEIVGTLRDTASTLPDTIRLWSHTTSRIIHRAELSWGRDNTLVLERAPAEPIPADWYNHEAHHSSEQPVRRIPPG